MEACEFEILPVAVRMDALVAYAGTALSEGASANSRFHVAGVLGGKIATSCSRVSRLPKTGIVIEVLCGRSR